MSPGNQSNAAQDELSNLVDDLIELARTTTGLDAEKLDELKQMFRDRIGKVGADAREAIGSMTGQAEEALRHADRYAHDKPWQLVATAALIGLALGMLVARR